MIHPAPLLFVNKAGLKGPADATAADVGTGCAECRGRAYITTFIFHY